MEFKNYKLLETVELPDLHGTGYRLEHIKTKAKVALIDCDDDNKVFTIGFRTPPSDDTGVPHIMEHSVLCGSKNFPVKDPFVELAKGSLNTFLNAMTYPDKTVYPVASQNDKDFQNLMHIYLDAVFYPNIYKYDEIFRQEGWNYSLACADAKLEYNGVVYNEMKGAFSSPDGVMEREICNSLFPDTPYGKESGGHPDAIPTLTYENFIAFHQKFYHPSNSYIYLYGKMDFDKKLKFIDENYLSQFDYKEIDSHIPLEDKVDKMIEINKDYPVNDGADITNATYYSYNKVVSTTLDKRTTLAMGILDYALISSPGAPLEKALIEAGIGDDISGYFETDLQQPYFSITAKNGPIGLGGKFVKTIEETLENIVKNGLDKKALYAGIASEEFCIRECDYGRLPQGLFYGLRNFSSWLYDETKPFIYSDLLNEYAWLKEQVKTDYFENLIKTYLIDNKHGSVITIRPVPGLESKLKAELETKLKSYKSSLSKEEVEDLVKKTKELKTYQEEPSSLEDMAKIPVLKRSDIEPKEKEHKYHNISGKANYLVHDINTNGIDYIKLYFPINHINHSDWTMLGVIQNVIGMINMDHFTYNEMASEVNLKTGGVDMAIEIGSTGKGKEQAYFTISGKALEPNLDDLINIFEEILIHEKFNDAKRIDEIMAQLLSRLKTEMLSAGHVAAMRRAGAHALPHFAFKECIEGLELYLNIPKFRKELENDSTAFVDKFTALYKQMLNTTGVVVSVGASESETLKIIDKVDSLIDKIRNYAVADYDKCKLDNYTIGAMREAVKTSSKVNYNARTAFLPEKDYAYTGYHSVLRTMLSYDYLWNNIRVLGGAYGCMSTFTRGEFAGLMTYRDPHIKRSQEVFEALPEYLANLNLDEDTITKFVIGTMSSYDAPLTIAGQITASTLDYLCDVTYDVRQKIRDEILSVTNDDLKNLSAYAAALMDANCTCTIGSADKINEHLDMFDSVIELN